MQRIAAPVALMRPSLEELFGFQLVHDRHETTRQSPESCRQRLLSNRRCSRENPENAGVSGDEIQPGQTRRKLRGGMRPKLRQQKSRAAASSRRFHGGGLFIGIGPL